MRPKSPLSDGNFAPAGMTIHVDFEPLELVGPDYPLESEDKLKEWLWQNRKDEILAAMTARHESESREAEWAELRLRLLDKIDQVQRQYLQMEDQKVVFGCLLSAVLDLMESEYGFIGEIKHDENGEIYLQTHAITNIAWDTATRAFYENNIESGLKFTNMNTLFGSVIMGKKSVIANKPKNHPHSAGVPRGHPPLNHFLGIPFFYKGEMNGMVGIANKPGGYREEDIKFLEPFNVTCSNLIQAYGQIQQNNHLINTLEEKVKERTSELERANKDLEEANRKVVRASQAQLQHFACMNHEIRTPLNCIIGLSSLLLETELSRMQEDSIRMIVTSGDLLLTVVNDVLDYSKLETGNVEVDIYRSNLQETLDTVVHSIDLKAQSKNVTLNTLYDTSLPEYIHTDSRRLQQILYNLLGNAIKFSPDNGSTVELFVKLRPPTVDEGSMGSISFIIKDYGKGIREEDQAKIFEPFVQATADTERFYGGTGLGLAITSKLVKCLGGCISVKSEVDRWSEFTVELPFDQERADMDIISSKMQNTTVFIVDDGSLCLAHLENVLQRYKIDFLAFRSMDELDQFVATRGRDMVSTHRCYICVVYEHLYMPGPFQRLGQLARTVLLSYGPKYSVKESKGHYRCPRRVIPSVMLESMISSVDASVSVSRHTSRIISSSSTTAPAVSHIDYKVLIAEDNLINQKVLCALLKRLRVTNIRVANNGQEAVKCESEDQYDVVFMDVQMPVMDGIEACRRILGRYSGEPTNGRHRRPKIIFVTASVSRELEAEALELGSHGFMAKPFNIQQLEKCLHEIATQ